MNTSFMRSNTKFPKRNVTLPLLALVAILLFASSCVTVTLYAEPDEEMAPLAVREMAPLTLQLPSAEGALTLGDNALSGTGQPGGQIEIVVDGQVVDIVTVGADGNWSYMARFDQAGDYQVLARTLDADGQVINTSETVILSFAAPEIEFAPPTLNIPSIEGGLTTGDIALSGTGQPGSQIEIVVDDQAVDTVTVGADGNWSYVARFDPAGDYQVLARALDPDGEVINTSDAFALSVVAEPAEPAPVGALSVIFPTDGGDVIVGQLTLVGTGDPGTQVEVLNGDASLGVTQTDEDSEWTFTFEPGLGSYQFVARLAANPSIASDTIGNQVVSASDPYDCTINAGIDRGDTFIVGTCDTMGTVAQATGVSLEALIAANPQIENPDLIYPGQILTIPQ
jgi:hypothetical protein